MNHRYASILHLTARQRLMIILIDLPIVDPIPSVLQFSILYQLSITVPKIIFKISSIKKPVSIVNLPKTTLLIIMILTPILDIGFALSEVPLAMAQTIAEISFIIISVAPVILSLTIGSIF